jgi:hypothetical protein
MRTAIRYGLPLASVWFAAIQAHASSITDFTFTSDPSPFTTDLVEMFSDSQAIVTGTIACDSATACKGEVGSFTLGADLTSPGTSVSVNLLGVLDGSTPAGVELKVSTPLTKALKFEIPAGSFNDTLISTSLPAFGMLDVAGSLDMRLAAGQAIALPFIIDLGSPSPVPEPSGEVALLAGVLGLAGVVRYRTARSRKATTS